MNQQGKPTCPCNGPASLDGALQVSFTNGFVAGTGDCFNVLNYAGGD